MQTHVCTAQAHVFVPAFLGCVSSACESRAGSVRERNGQDVAPGDTHTVISVVTAWFV